MLFWFICERDAFVKPSGKSPPGLTDTAGSVIHRCSAEVERAYILLQMIKYNN